MCLMIRITMVPPPPPPSPPLTLFHKMSRIADCQCDISCFFPSLPTSPLASASSCVCLVFVLNMDCVCLYMCVSICVSVCESVCSRNCVAHFLRMPTMAMAMAMLSAAWNTFFVSMETGMICPQPETCSMLRPPFPLLHSTSLWSPLDRIAVWLEKPQDFPSTIFQSLPRLCYLFVSLSQSCLGLGYTENNLNPQRVLGIKKFKAIKSSHRQPPLGSHSPNSGTDKQTASRN